jgi:uncharacterized damage-inducible protein DinB
MTDRPTVTTLRSLFVHNDWARDKLLRIAAGLDESMLDTPLEMGPGSLRLTLQHLWRTERWWLDRWQGLPEEPDKREPPDPTMSMARLAEHFAATAAEREALLDEAGPAGESVPRQFMGFGAEQSAPLGDLMLHVCNHGFHHRAQVLNMLRRLGADTPRIDYLFLTIDGDPPAVDYDPPTIAEYYRYADWARQQVHTLAAALPDDRLDQTLEMGRGTLRKTLLHIYDAECWWMDNWSGTPAERFSPLPDTTTLDELQGLFKTTATRRFELLDAVDGGELHRKVTARPVADHELTFALGETMIQLCGHGTHHRAQALNMLRRLGVTVPDIDYVDWLSDSHLSRPSPTVRRSK